MFLTILDAIVAFPLLHASRNQCISVSTTGTRGIKDMREERKHKVSRWLKQQRVSPCSFRAKFAQAARSITGEGFSVSSYLLQKDNEWKQIARQYAVLIAVLGAIILQHDRNCGRLWADGTLGQPFRVE